VPLRKFDEDLDSRELVEFPPRISARWICTGLDNSNEVQVVALGFLAQMQPSPFGILYRQPLIINRLGYQVHEVLVEWAQQKWSPFDFTIRGRTTGGMQKILGSFATVAKSANAPDFGGLIGVQDDGTIEGAEVPIGVQEFAVEVTYPLGYLSHAMMAAWSDNVGCTNLNPWRGWSARQLLYMGSDYEDGTNIPTRVAHNLIRGRHLKQVTVCGLGPFDKAAHDHLWFRTVEQTHTVGGSTFKVKRATHYYVERVTVAVDFTIIFGF
jgi:hypothetical protein